MIGRPCQNSDIQCSVLRGETVFRSKATSKAEPRFGGSIINTKGFYNKSRCVVMPCTKQPNPGVLGGIKIKIRALDALFCGKSKSHTEKFEADTDQIEKNIRFSTIFHASTFVYSVHAVG
jgi:hypothetical protein